jgi:hypothetical protein
MESCYAGLVIILISLPCVTFFVGMRLCCIAMAVGQIDDLSPKVEGADCLHLGISIVTFLEVVGHMTNVQCNLLQRT